MIRNNQAIRTLRSAAFSAGLLLTTVTAATAQTPEDRTQEQYACTFVMIPGQSGALYEVCVRGLDSSVSAAQQQGNEAVANPDDGFSFAAR